MKRLGGPGSVGAFKAEANRKRMTSEMFAKEREGLVMRCWVCGQKLGPVVGPLRNSDCAVVQDPLGGEHRTHLICAKDADGKQIRTEPVLPPELR